MYKSTMLIKVETAIRMQRAQLISIWLDAHALGQTGMLPWWADRIQDVNDTHTQYVQFCKSQGVQL